MTLYLRLKDWLISHKIDCLAVAVFFIYACVMTWPFAAKPFTTLTAPLAGDVSNSVTKFDGLKHDNLNPLDDHHIPSIAAPDGIKSNVGVDRVSFFSTLYLWTTTNLTNSVFAHGLFTLLGYFLTGSIMYFFIKRFTGSSKIAFIAGFAYCLFPLFVSLARAAPIYNHMWLYILPVWAFLKLHASFTKKHAAIALLSIVPALFWTPYYSFHILLIGGTLLAASLPLLYKQKGRRQTLLLGGIGALSLLLLCVFYYLVGMSNSHGEVPIRTLQEAYDQSAHPLMYLLPPATTWWGEAGYNFLVSVVPRANTTSLYLGISIILLSFSGLLVLLISKFRQLLPREIRLFGIFGAAISLVCFLFSLAPTISILGINIPTPNYLVSDFVPALRAGQRLAMPLMLGLLILSSVALYVLFKRLTPRNALIAALCIFTVVCFDLSSRPPTMTSVLPRYSSIQQLSMEKEGIVALYLNGDLFGDPNQLACQLKLQHQMPILNNCALDTFKKYDSFTPTVRQVWFHSLPEQPAAMERIGVAYVIIDKSDEDTIESFSSSRSPYVQFLEDDRFLIFRQR